MRALLLACLLAVSLLSGCATPPAGTSADQALVPSDPWPAVRAAMKDVPCQATLQGDASTPNLKLLGSLVLPSANDGIHAELDVRGDLMVHARYGSSGFELYDIHDPMAPVHLGSWTNDKSDGALDVKFTPDNATVLVGVGNGIHLVDVRNRTDPRQVGDWDASQASPATGPAATLEYNSHMMYTKRIGGTDWLFLAPNSNSGIWILKIEGTPEARKLTYVTQTLPVEGGPLGPHDLYVQKDATDGHWYLYSADGFHGWTAFNVDDPAHPVPAGGWVNPVELSYTHTIQATTLNGKRIVATIGEVGGNLLRIYDATVLAAPVLLGVWQANTQDTGSPEHNFNIAGGNLFLSYYGHGMYVFNLTTLTAGPTVPAAATVTMQPVAHWAVDGEGAGAGPLGFNGSWDTVVKDGVIYVSYIEGGLVVLGYGCNQLPDPRLTSDG